MLLVNFKKWSNTNIFIALVLITVVFAFFMPQSQRSKNIKLYEAVLENNITRAQHWIDKGAQKNLLLPKGIPLISLAIEHENAAMVTLLMLEKEDLSRDYKGYHIIEHAIKKDNKKILEMMIKTLGQK
jgi:hypothetical protein